MRLDELVASIPSVIEADSAVVEVHDVEHDSRAVAPGALFACIPGAVHDGHDHAPAAVAAGAIGLLAERRLGIDVPQIVVPDVRAAIGPAAAWARRRRATGAP